MTEHGKIHTDGSRSGGQPVTNDKDSAVIADAEERMFGERHPSQIKGNCPTCGMALRQPTQSDAQLIANERKAIAAWLRGEVDTDYTDPEYDIGRNLADAVERGAYIQDQSK